MVLSLLLLWSVACSEPSFTPHREVSAVWGNRVSQFEKGLAYQEGSEGEKDLIKALHWYEASATQTNHIVKPNQTIIDIADLPDQALEELAEILKDAVVNLLPPAQFLFTYIAAIPKKDPRDKRGIGVLPTPVRILGRLLKPNDVGSATSSRLPFSPDAGPA